MITMFNTVSADGFISRMDRSADFIPDQMWPEFLDMCRQYDSIIIGRKTYDTFQGYDESLVHAFEDLSIRKIVVSRDDNFHPKAGYVVARSPKEACDSAGNALMCSGPTLNTSALDDCLVDKIVLEKLPIKLVDGYKMFEEGTEAHLTLLSEEKKAGGRQRETYSVSYPAVAEAA